MGKFIDLTGVKFGRWTVLNRAENDKQGRAKWRCACDCGQILITASYNLTSGRSNSCGCLNKELTSKATSTHGLSKTKIHKTWREMKSRCYYEKCEQYPNYGGRGIVICDKWKNNFVLFHEWSIENGYKEELSIDRIDVNGNYEPKNCRWTTMKIQQRNRRNNHLITYNGETKTMTEWAERCGIQPKTLSARLIKFKWSIEKSLNTPSRGRPK